jgi:hypothetical protein
LEEEFTMDINVQVPEDIAHSLAADASAMQQTVLESLALEGVRSCRISRGQVRRLLGFRTRYEVDGFLKDHGIPIEDRLENVLNDGESIQAMRA